MTYRNVNRKRLAWLIGRGLSPEELRKFFKDKRTPLLLAGVKAQDAPKNSNDAIQTIVRFDDKANAIFAAWLKPLEVDSAELYAEQVLPFVQAMETLELRLPDAETHKIARLGLKDLFSDSPSSSWLEFLTTDIQVQAEPPTSAAPPVGSSPKHMTAKEAQLIAEWVVTGGDAPSALESPWVETILIADAIKFGVTEQLIQRFSGEVVETVQAAHAQFQKTRAPIAKAVGLVTEEPEMRSFDPGESYVAKEVIATHSSGSGPYFLDVLAFIDDRGAFSLDDADLLRALPEEGRIILHADARLGVPSPGVAETYQVERYPTSRPIKFRAVRHGRKLLEVMFVPHPSTANDAVRTWIAESAHAESASRSPRVFVLADGLCIRTKHESRMPAGGASSDWTFDCWASLKGIQLAGRTYIPEPLPTADGEYECQPPATIARRFLRTLSEVKGAKYTKQQLTDLSAFLVDEQVAVADGLRNRLLTNARFLQSSDVHFDEIVQELLKADAVKQEIERCKQEALTSTANELKAERDRLANLRKERQEIEAKIKSLRSDAVQRSREVSAAIKKAFKHASENELETFGQLALIRTLTDIGPRVADEQVSVGEASPDLEQIKADGSDLSQALLRLGYAPERARFVKKLLECAKRSGAPVILKGIGANRLARRFATCLTASHASVVDVAVGEFSSFVTKQAIGSGADVIVFTSANLSCPTGYAQPVIAGVFDSLLDTQGSANVFAVFAAVDGPMSLPWPAELRSISLRLDLDSDVPIVASASDERSPLQKKLWARIERIAEDAEMNSAEVAAMNSMFAGRSDLTADAS